MALLCSALAGAEEGGIPPVASGIPDIPTVSLAEDPPALLTLEQVIDGAELRVKGSWKAGVSTSPKLSWGNTGFSAAFEGIPLAFAQRPDLEIHLGFLDAWAFEALLGPEGEADSMALSYEGEAGALLRKAVAGNRGLAIPRLFSLSLAENAARWPGISLGLGDESGLGADGPWRFSADALLRYEENAVEERRYRGRTLVRRWPAGAGEYLRGRFFRLPDSGISDLRLFVRDDAGSHAAMDGYRYAERSLSGQYLALSEGRIALTDQIRERALITYRTASGDPPAGATEEIDGSAALLLFDPLVQTLPWEDLSYYPLPEEITGRGMARVAVEFSDPLAPALFEALLGEFPACFRLVRADHPEPADMISRRPFADAFPWIYEPANDRSPDISTTIILEMYEEVDSYDLPFDVIPSSINVWMRGIKTDEWTYKTPSLSFQGAVGPNDDILIRYSRARSTWSGTAGGMSLGISVDAVPRDAVFLHAGGGFSWALPFAPPSSSQEARPGKAVLEAALGWRPEALDMALSGSLSYDAADARDLLRILTMESRQVVFDPLGSSWLPSKDPLSPSGLDPETRVLPLFRDYLRRGPFGTTLMPLDWEEAPEALDPSLRAGPYPIAEERYGEVIVLEADLPAGAWTGVQARFGEDLRSLAPGTMSFVLPVLWKGIEGPLPTFILQAGIVGGGEGEEGAPQEDLRVIASQEFTPGGEWTLVEIPVGGAVLGGAGSGLRIIMRSPAACSGRLLVGLGFLRGASFRLEAEDPSAEFIMEERSSLEEADDPAAAFSEDYARFHGDGGPNGYLRLSAVSNPLGEAVALFAATASSDPVSHRRLSFFLRPSADLSPGTTMRLSLEDGSGAALSWNAAIGSLDRSWHRIDLDLAEAEATLLAADGARIVFGSMTGGIGILRRVVIAFEGMAEGSVDLDELHFAEPSGRLTSFLEGSLSWKPDWRLLPFAGTSLLSEPSIAIATTFLASSLPLWTAKARAGAKLLWLSIIGGLDLSWPLGGTPAFALRHEFALPLGILEAHSRFDSRLGLDWDAFDSLRIGWTKSFVKAESGAAADGEKGESSVSLAVALGMGEERLEASLSHVRRDSLPAALLTGDYLGDLAKSWEYRFVPPASSTARRSSSAALRLGRQESPRIDLSVEAATDYEGRPTGLSTGSLAARFSPAIGFGPAGSLVLTPLYSRSANFARPLQSPGLGGDLDAWRDLATFATPYWLGLPFAEFIDGSAADLLGTMAFDPLSYALASDAGISLERAAGLGWLDLLVPIRAEWKQGRRDERRGSLVSGTTTLSASIEHAAVDVFGTRGALPLAAGWAEDEYYSLHRIGVAWSGSTERPEVDWLSEMQAAWTSDGGYSLRLAEDFSLFRGASETGIAWSNRLSAVSSHETWAEDGLDARRIEFAEWLSRRAADGKGPRLPFLLKALESGRLRSCREWTLALELSEDGSFSWKLPVSWTAGLKLGGTADARSSLGFSAAGVGIESFSLGFSLAASLLFSF